MNKIKGNKQEKVAVLIVSLHTQDRVEGFFFFFFSDVLVHVCFQMLWHHLYPRLPGV